MYLYYVTCTFTCTSAILCASTNTYNCTMYLLTSLDDIFLLYPQRQKNTVGVSALPTGKFLRVRKVFARTTLSPKTSQNMA